MSHKIGVGIITCNAESRIRQSGPTVPQADYMVIINDGKPYANDAYPKGIEVIQHTMNKNVGISKNEAMRYLIQKGADSIFIVEDDMLIKRQDVYEAYIKTAEKTGIWHLNFALHGPANKKQIQQGPMNVQDRHLLDQNSAPNPRQIVSYGDVDLALYPNCVGSFSYYLKSVIKNIGYIDERYKGAWDHVEHTYRIIKAKLHPPFWWFADIANSGDYITEIPGSIENSTIAHTPEWMKNFREGMEWYKFKHGWYPQQTPHTSPEDVMKSLEFLETNYKHKVL